MVVMYRHCKHVRSHVGCSNASIVLHYVRPEQAIRDEHSLKHPSEMGMQISGVRISSRVSQGMGMILSHSPGTCPD